MDTMCNVKFLQIIKPYMGEKMPHEQANLGKGTQGQINRSWRKQKFKKEGFFKNICSKTFVL